MNGSRVPRVSVIVFLVLVGQVALGARFWKREIYCDFNVFPDQAIFGNNDETLRSRTVDECKESCVEKNDGCWSFDYVQRSQTCYLSSVNRTTAPRGDFGPHARSDYYEKYCVDVEPTTPAGPLVQATSAGGLLECKRSRLGRDYRGSVTQTGTGRECQRWDSQSPHPHGQEDKNFPDRSMSAAENQCRNPDGVAGGPWCYTTDPDVRWEYCKVPVCSDHEYCDDPVNCAAHPCHVSTCEAFPDARCLPVFCVTCHGAYFLGGKQVDCVIPPGADDCKTTKTGQEYVGTVSHTGTGRQCQRWDSQSPHAHEQLPGNFPEGSFSAAENYCRNPDGVLGGPWCYTEDRHVRWEYCNIPEC